MFAGQEDTVLLAMLSDTNGRTEGGAEDCADCTLALET